MPVSVLLYSDLGIKTGRKSEDAPALKDNFSNRLLYINQLIIGRKFNRNLSLEILPTIMYRNLVMKESDKLVTFFHYCLLYTSPSPRDLSTSRMPSSA